MASSFRDYFIGLCLVLAAAGGYQITAAKWLQPPSIEHAPIADRPLNDHDNSLADLYPAEAWQRGRAIRLKTQDGMLLFQNWEQSKDDRDGGKKWRLWPITMVIGRGLAADGAEQPMLIEASEGAVIEFSAPLDVMSGVAPTIQRGQLLGEVHIRRVPAIPSTTKPGADLDSDPKSAYQVRHQSGDASGNQTLDIRTANVGIDRRKIWTTEAIEMRVGRAVMIGRDLTLHLAASASDPNSRSSLARSLDRMELIYLRELTLPLGSISDPNSPSGSGPGSEEDKGVVQIHCDGRIEYDFALDQLLMDRNVRLVHQSTPSNAAAKLIDQFECHSLRLTLRDPMNSDRVRATALDWIDRIEASGTPVRLSMQTQQFELTAGQVLFDPLEGWLIAESVPLVSPSTSTPITSAVSGAEESPSHVQLRRGDMHASLSRIVYRFDPKHPMQLGSVEVEGQGSVDYDSSESVVESFSWRDSLKIAPLEVATADDLNVRFGVWCDGDIRSTLADGGSFQTDRIEGVLRPVTDETSASAGTLDRSWFPDRFSAIGNVEVRSNQLHASTPVMNLFFEQGAKNVSKPLGASSSATPESPLRQWVSQPRADAGGEAAGSSDKPSQPPATIRGDQVTAKLTFGAGELTATDLSVVGNVEVTHSLALRQAKNKVSRAPTLAAAEATETMLAVMTGDHLRLRHGGGDGDVLQLGSESQRPARLELGDGYFIGPEIQVRPDDNYIWIPSAGEFVVPSAFLPALGGDIDGRSGSGEPAQQMRWTQSPRGRFGGSMTFDGRAAKLAGGVVLQAAIAQGRQPSELRMRGDELIFTLETPVDLRSPATFRATQLAQVSLKQITNQPVEIHVDRFAADGSRESRHEMLVSELTWIPGGAEDQGNASPGAPKNGGSASESSFATALSGDVIAPGPGSYRGWLRTANKQSALANKTDSGNAADGDRASEGSVFLEGMIEDDRGPRFGNTQTPVPKTLITGVHLIYQDGMRGDFLGRSLTFQRGVRIGRKSMPDFDARFDAADMNLLSQDELTLDCDQLRLAIDPSVAVQQSRFSAQAGGGSSGPALEVEASGGVVFRSRNDRGLSEATAQRCGYAVSKDLVTIEGLPGRPARFQQTDPTGRPGPQAAIISMTLRLRPFELVDSQVESLSAGPLPGGRLGTK